MRRITLLLALVALVTGISATPVFAGRTWCARDPIISLNGAPVQIWVAIPEEYQPAINGPIVVKVWTPAKISRDVLFTDDGFNGHGEVVKFANLTGVTATGDGSFRVKITATVSVDSNRLRELGGKGTRVPIQLSVVANGKYHSGAYSVPQVVDGESWLVEGSSAGTNMTFTVRPSALVPES